MKLFIDIVMKRIYLFNTVAWNYRKKIGFPVCKKENFAGLLEHRNCGKSARASPTPHHTLSKERSDRFTAQPLSALAMTDDDSVENQRMVSNYIMVIFLSGIQNLWKSFRRVKAPSNRPSRSPFFFFFFQLLIKSSLWANIQRHY